MRCTQLHPSSINSPLSQIITSLLKNVQSMSVKRIFITFVVHHNLVGRKVLGGVFEIDVVRLAVGFITVFLYTDHARRNIAMQRLKGNGIATVTFEMIFNFLYQRLAVPYGEVA